jgi:hypothetical protein
MPQIVVIANIITYVKPCNKEKSVVSLPMVEHRFKEIDLNVVIYISKHVQVSARRKL